MINQKGFSSVIALAILALLGIGFYVGATSQRLIVSDFTGLLKSPKPSIVPVSSPSIAPAIKNYRTNYNAQKPYTATSDNDKVSFDGVYYIGDFDKISFTIVLPKRGGAITGDITGACTGKITGNAESPDRNGDSRISGEVNGACKPVPRFSFNVGVKLTYEGIAHFNSGVVDVVYVASEPYSTRGYFNLYFTSPLATIAPTPTSAPVQSSTNTSNPNAPTFIKVTYPNGGENFKVGDTIHVTWDSNNLNKNGSCIVSLVYDNGAKSSAWVPVNTANGFFDWKLTTESGGRKVKVDTDCYDSNQNNVHDQSDSFFIVTN